MTPFIILYIYLIIVTLVFSKEKEPSGKAKKQCFFYFLGMLFLLGFHSPTLGVDVDGFYVPFFGSCLNDDFTFSIIGGGTEPLFHAYTRMIRTFTDDVQVYLFITAIIILFPVVYFFYKDAKNPYLPVLFFVSFTLFHFAFSGLRQAMAISFVCMGYYYMMKDKWKPFVLFVLIAFTFHTSAIIALIAYPLKKIKLPDFIWLGIFVIFGLAIAAMPSIMLVFVDLIFSDLGKYQSELNESGGSINLAFLYLAFALFQYYLAKKNKENSMIQFTLLLFVIQLTGLRSNFAARIGYYFLPLMFLYISNSIESLKNKRNRIFLVVSLTIFLIFFFIYSNGSGYLEVIPYRFCWQ